MKPLHDYVEEEYLTERVETHMTAVTAALVLSLQAHCWEFSFFVAWLKRQPSDGRQYILVFAFRLASWRVDS